MYRELIIEAVRAKMDEINPLDQGETIVDPQIEAQLDGAAIDLLEKLPSILCSPVVAEDVEPENFIAEMSVDIPCPANFIRLHRLRLGNWVRGISDLLPQNDPQVLLQDYKHLKATIRRPIGVLSRNVDGDVITCYPPPDVVYANEVEVAEFLYVDKPDDVEEMLSNKPDLLEMFVWNCAAIVYVIHGQGANAEACNKKLVEMIEQKMLKYRS